MQQFAKEYNDSRSRVEDRKNYADNFDAIDWHRDEEKIPKKKEQNEHERDNT